MANVVGKDLRNVQIILIIGIESFSGEISGKMELKKRLTQNNIQYMIIKEQDGVKNKIMLDFKFLCSRSSAYKHAEGTFGGGVEVR
jgi:hypothetical protein